jgi:hypothetical protein
MYTVVCEIYNNSFVSRKPPGGDHHDKNKAPKIRLNAMDGRIIVMIGCFGP